MRIYRCDKCNRLLEPKERFCGHIEDHIVDLCEVCHTEYKRDVEMAERMYRKNMDAIAVKYGMKSISELLKKGEPR